MPHLFHIAFPFEVAVIRYRPGGHAPLCTHPIPLSFTETCSCDAIPGFAFARQWYANKLLTVDLIEGGSSEPFVAVLKQSRVPAYVLATTLEGRFRYDRPGGGPPETPPPGTVYFARLCGAEYPIHFPAGNGRLLLIAVHAAQLDVIGEDFEELASLLAATPLTEDIIGPPIQADGLLMRRLIRLISPKGIKRRKDFNRHLSEHLPGVCSAIKGIQRGKGQVQYDNDKLASVIAFIERHEHEHGLPPELAAVIDFACVSADKLERLFHSGPGITPAAYLLAHKLEAIKAQLLATDDPVYLIAQQFGYSDSAAMNKPFKKHFGLSPVQLRRQRKRS